MKIMWVILSLAVAMVLSNEQLMHAQVNQLKRNPLPSSDLLTRFGLERGWWAYATMNPTRDKLRHVVNDERSLVTVSTSGLITSFNAETGEKEWVNSIGRPNQASFPPVMNDRQLLIVIGLKIYSLDRRNGGLIWQLRIPKMPSTAPAADDDQIYIGSLDGSVFAFDLRTIRQLNSEGKLPEYTENAKMWRYRAGGRITSQPIATGRTVSFASEDHSLYTVSARVRRLLYQFETDAPITAPLVRNQDKIFLASEDFNFYCLNAQNGQVMWSFLSGLPIRKPAYVVRPQVFVLPDSGGGISSLNVHNGLPTWSQPNLRAVDFLAAGLNTVFVTDRLGNVLLLDRGTGETFGMLPVYDFDHKVNNSRTDRLYLAQSSGLVVMIREQDRTFPTYHLYPERKPISAELFNPETHSVPDAPPQLDNPDNSEPENSGFSF